MNINIAHFITQTTCRLPSPVTATRDTAATPWTPKNTGLAWHGEGIAINAARRRQWSGYEKMPCYVDNFNTVVYFTG
jgi:hypothetical protein